MAFNGATKTVDTISELKEIVGSPDTAARILSLHRNTDGDMGGGLFYWAPSSTETADDVLTIAVTGVTTGRWKRIIEGGQYVAWWWGAVGDGTTDCTAALNAAFAATGNYDSLIIPFGQYLISGPVNFGSASNAKTNAKIAFSGRLITNNSSGITFENCTFCRITDMSIQNSVRTWTSENMGVIFRNFNNNEVSFRDVLNFKYNLYMDGTTGEVAYNNFRCGRIINGYYNLYCNISTVSGSVYFNENTFYAMDFALSGTVADGADAVGSFAVSIGFVSSASQPNNNRFISCTFENVRNGVRIGTNGGTWVRNFLFMGCRWESVREAHLAGAFRQTAFIGGYGLDQFNSTKMAFDGSLSRGNIFLTGGEAQDSCITDESQGGWGFLDAAGKVSSKLHNVSNKTAPILTDKTGAIHNLNKGREAANLSALTGTFDVGSVIWATAPAPGQPVFAVCTSAGTNGTLAGLTCSGTSGQNFITAVGTVPASMNTRYIKLNGTDKYRVAYTKGQTIYLQSNLTTTYAAGTTVEYSNDATFFLAGNYVANNGISLNPADGSQLTGNLNYGAITPNSNTTGSINYPTTGGQSWTFNGAYSGLNERERSFTLYLDRLGLGSSLYFQRYDTAGVAQGFRMIRDTINTPMGAIIDTSKNGVYVPSGGDLNAIDFDKWGLYNAGAANTPPVTGTSNFWWVYTQYQYTAGDKIQFAWPFRDVTSGLWMRTHDGVAGTWSSWVRIDAGGSTGNVKGFFTNVGNTSTTPNNFTALYQYNIPANTLKQDGQSVEAEYSGIFADNANGKSLANFTDGVQTSHTPITQANGSWKVFVSLTRSGATTARLDFTIVTNTISYTTYQEGLTGLDFTQPIQFDLWGAGGGAVNDVIAKRGKITL